ncbi:MFS transporter [Nocardioides sp. NBC_00163]|uniref:MFS transporter n=1 Tax=Nocardioides sp. NBC_00163 TaxID=2975999 RepID=UPI003254BEE8
MTTYSPPAQPDGGAAQRKELNRRTLVGVSLGNALEVFDWTAYAVLAPFFASQVFNPADPTSALLSTLLVFGAGFVVRPFGGALFGWIADRRGRRASLMAAIACASVGMALIATVPTYEQAGIWAGLVLLVARLLQGLAHTGEVAAAYTYVAEEAPSERRGLWSSAIYVSGYMAIMVATILGAVLATTLSDASMNAWGWRLPFVLGAILGVVTLGLRRRMNETELFERHVGTEVVRRSLIKDLWMHRAAGLRVFVLMGSLTAMFYAWVVSGPSWATSVAGLERSSALWAGVVALAVGVVALPVFGAMSDRFGRRLNVVLFGVLTAVLAFPLEWLGRQGLAQFLVAMTVAVLVYSLVASVLPAVLCELFPTSVRASGVAVPYALSAVVFGGTAPYLQQWAAQSGHGALFTGYLAVAGLLGAALMAVTPETRDVDLNH